MPISQTLTELIIGVVHNEIALCAEGSKGLETQSIKAVGVEQYKKVYVVSVALAICAALRCSPDQNPIQKHQDMSLHEAIKRQDLSELRALLSVGQVDVNEQDDVRIWPLEYMVDGY